VKDSQNTYILIGAGGILVIKLLMINVSALIELLAMTNIGN